MEYEYYDPFINKNTKGRYDVTPLFRDHDVFSNLLTDLADHIEDIKFDAIAGIDALGFVIGAPLAQLKKVGFITIRKGGKLPGRKGTVLRQSFIDYTKQRKSLEIGNDSIKKGENVLIVDEWIETGAQVKAGIKLIEKLGGRVTGILAIVVENNNSTRVLFEKYNCTAIRVVDRS